MFTFVTTSQETIENIYCRLDKQKILCGFFHQNRHAVEVDYNTVSKASSDCKLFDALASPDDLLWAPA